MLKLSRLAFPALVIVLALLAGLVAGMPAAPGRAHAPAEPAAAQQHDGHAPAKEPSIMDKLILHVLDGAEIHIFNSIWPHSVPLQEYLGKPFTRFLVIELLSAALILAIYIPLARKVRTGEPVHGWFWNAFEVLLTFVRDQIAKPSIGDEHADRYVPFLWTLFLFILFNNLMGMVPFMGSPTADIFVTGALALIVFFAIHGSAIIEMARRPRTATTSTATTSTATASTALTSTPMPGRTRNSRPWRTDWAATSRRFGRRSICRSFRWGF